MYKAKKGNYIFTDQIANDFQVIYNMRLRKYQMYNNGITVTFGREGQKYWNDFFGETFRRN